MICTYDAGYFQGHTFVFRAVDRFERDIWWRCIVRVFRNHDDIFGHDDANKAVKSYTNIGRLRRRMRWIYLGDQSQIFVAVLVSGTLPIANHIWRAPIPYMRRRRHFRYRRWCLDYSNGRHSRACKRPSVRSIPNDVQSLNVYHTRTHVHRLQVTSFSTWWRRS